MPSQTTDRDTLDDPSPTETANATTFLDCLTTSILTSLAPTPTKGRKSKRQQKPKPAATLRSTSATAPTGPAADAPTARPTSPRDGGGSSQGPSASDVADFTAHLSSEIFPSLPDDFRALSYATLQADATLSETYSTPLSLTAVEDLCASVPPTALDVLTAYDLLRASETSPNHVDDATAHLPAFLAPVLNAYVQAATKAPPASLPAQRATACEICERDWIPLTYHHLIPRSTHAKVLKRGWHEEWKLADVAWLCRACHSYVHGLESNEALARHYYSVDLLIEREDVQKWAKWMGGVRWKKR